MIKRTSADKALAAYMVEYIRDYDTHVDAFADMIYNHRHEQVELVRQACQNILDCIDLGYQCQEQDE